MIAPKLEFNTSNVYSAVPTTGWVDISAYVDWIAGVSIQSGRADESSQVTQAIFKAVLTNIDGRFTPGNTSSPYYPDISTPTWIRYTTLDASLSITQPEFTGLAVSWLPDFTGPNSDRGTVLTANDQMYRLSKFRQIKSSLHEEILLDNPIAYYPCDEGSGADSFSDQSGLLQPPLQILSIGASGTLDTGGTDGPPGTGEKAPNFQPDYVSTAAIGYGTGYGKYLAVNLKTPLVVGSGHAYTLEFWFKINNQGAGANTPGQQPFYPGMMMQDPAVPAIYYGGFYQCTVPTSPPATGGPYVRYGSGSQMLLNLGDGTSVTQAVGRSGSLQPGIWHHFAIVSTGANTANGALFYMDGHFMANMLDEPQGFGHQTADPPPATVKNLTQLWLAALPAFGGILLDGSVAHAAVYQSALTQPRLLQHYLAGRNGFYGESIRNRLVRLLKYAGMGDQSASVALEAADTPVVDQSPAAALSMIHDLEVTEQGLFFIDPTGLPTFWNRSHPYTSPVFTIDATPGTGVLTDGDIVPVLDDQRLINDVSTTSGGNSTSRAVDAASVALNGVYQQSLSTVGASPTNADETSRWIVATHSTVNVRIPSITIDLLTQPALRAAAVATKLWDRLRFTNLSTGYVFGDMVIEGMQRTYSRDKQQIMFTVAPNITAVAPYVIGTAGSDEIDTSANRLGF